MSLKAVWSFTAATSADLNDDMGWTTNVTVAATNPSQAHVKSFTGDATDRWSLRVNDNQLVYPPAPFQPTAFEGGWGFWMKIVGSPSIGRIIAKHDGVSLENYIRINTTQNLALYVRQTFQGLAQNLDLGLWHYIGFKSKLGVNPQIAELWIDGVQEVTGSEAGGGETEGESFHLTGAVATSPNGSYFGGLVAYSAYTDSVGDVLYMSTVPPSEDNPGATQVNFPNSTEASQHAAVSGNPMDTAKYVDEPTPVSGDRVNLGIGGAGGTDDLADAIGLATADMVVSGISLHTYSKGEAINAKAVISTGANDTDGNTVAIDASNTTYAHAFAAQNPTGPATWDGDDQPELNYEII